MRLSYHARLRMSERHLTPEDIASTLDYGVVIKEKSLGSRIVFEHNGVWVVATSGWDPCVITAFIK
ncbi:DUF4258 domain-containing protein [Photobacterium japonica]|uniref:DUF4258 domain-containing protein n=1 Tax=Photobacterium japonica TaxID=2910235 RepID=UPI003D0A2AA2